jgi:hypothetical protein
MRNKLIILCLLVVHQLCAQELKPRVIASAGSYKEASSVGINYTIGEPLIQTATETNNILTFGFNQPESITNAVVDIEGKTIDVKLYPNPMQESLNIELKGDLNTRLIFTLTDLSGRQLLSKNLDVGQKTLAMPTNELSNGIYLLEMRHPEKGVLKSFQIAKAQ